MDWLPPGGLERVFADYDRIVSHHGAPEAPSPVSPESGPTNSQETPKPDPPPWQPIETPEAPPPEAPPTEAPAKTQPPEEWYGPRPLTTKKERDAQRMKDTGGYDLGDRLALGEQRLKEHIDNPSGATFKQDEAGLDQAYLDKTSKGVYYDPASRTEYVKGTVMTSAKDWYDDFTKIPFWGDTRNADRYQQAEAAYNDLQAHGKPVDRIVGHSLGGSVALQLQQDKGIPTSRTFGAPVMDLNPMHRIYGKTERYRHPIDPVSMLDSGANNGKFKLYPHSYTDFEDYDVK